MITRGTTHLKGVETNEECETRQYPSRRSKLAAPRQMTTALPPELTCSSQSLNRKHDLIW
jgi:hypothetical protein